MTVVAIFTIVQTLSEKKAEKRPEAARACLKKLKEKTRLPRSNVPKALLKLLEKAATQTVDAVGDEAIDLEAELEQLLDDELGNDDAVADEPAPAEIEVEE